MSILTPDSVSLTRPQSKREKLLTRLWRLLCGSWELGPILIVATFFRVYGDHNAFFIDDQASMWRLARDSVTHHLLLASSNRSSLGILHGYFISYFLMPVAALTANPVWGAVETGLFNVLGVFLTYLFVRRYYGRLTGALAATLYAIGTVLVLYNRYIWQPNLVPPLVVAFMFCLYWGAVERRRGWFLPAVVLLGLLYETHESSILMVLPLLVALGLAGVKTLRWRDLLLAGLALFLIFSPYLTWLVSSGFVDIQILLQKSESSQINGKIFLFYAFFTSPYVSNPIAFTGRLMREPWNFVSVLPNDPQSVLVGKTHLLGVIRGFLYSMFFLSAALALSGGVLIVRALFLGQRVDASSERQGLQRIVGWFKDWWWTIASTPEKRGYVLLLVWQGIIPLFLMRSPTFFYAHYTIYLLPGPFLLMALFLGKAFRWSSEHHRRWRPMLRVALSGLTVMVICGYLIGTTGAVTDIARGNFDSSLNKPIYMNDVASLRNAVQESDRVARAHGIHHIYMAANLAVSESLQYFARDISTPTTVFDTLRCLILPSQQVGPVVYLVAPYSPLAEILLHQYAQATLISQPARVGGAPFHLYILSGKSTTLHVQRPYTHDLSLLDTHVRRVSSDRQSWMVTSWQFTNSEAPDWRTTYEYEFNATFAGKKRLTAPTQATQCTTTRLQAGDQLLSAFELTSTKVVTPAQLALRTTYLEFKPWLVNAGPLQFQTYNDRVVKTRDLQTSNGTQSLTLPGSSS